MTKRRTSKRRTSRRPVRRNTLVESKLLRRKPPALARGNVYVFQPFAEAPPVSSPEFRAALNDPRTRVRYADRDDAVAAVRELDRDYPSLRWHVTDAQVPAGRTSRRIRPNVIPPPPTHRPTSHPAYIDWHKRTFAPGTRVRYRKHVNVWVPKGKAGQTVPLPSGTRGEVVAWIGPDQWGAPERVSIRLYDNRSYMPHGTDRDTMDWVFDTVLAGVDPVIIDSVTTLFDRLEPLDDNWASTAKPLKHYQLPASQKRTSRKLRPNATCPACGSPHYFEGLTTRDCATPTCRYYRGGTIGPTGAAEPAASSPKRTGSRRLAVTSETVHASEPDVYPEIDNESEEDIVIEADDLDDDETFAERAAKVIADELGYVEGSEMGAGAVPRWYTQSDSDEDYSTGDSTRRSIHIDNGEWTAEEKREIYDALKRRKLVS